MNKVIYPIAKKVSNKVMICPRCNYVTEHILFDYKYAIYKCTKCGNLHA